MKQIIASGAFLALTALAAPAPASDILGACEAEIESRCSDVTLGNGRLMSCLYAYEDQLSAECGTAMADAADILDFLFDRLRYVNQECGEDIRQHCSDVQVGEGRIFSCLKAESTVSESCKTAMSSVSLPAD